MFHSHPYLFLEHLYVASLFYTLIQDMLGRFGPLTGPIGSGTRVGGSRDAVIWKTSAVLHFVLYRLVCCSALSSLSTQTSGVVW